MKWDGYPPIAEWMDLDEKRFHEYLLDRVRAHGIFADAFPLMVMHNVPHFVLSSLWPLKWEKYRRSPEPVAFAIAEDGWQGRTKNIKSRLEARGPRYHLEFSKNYVVDSDVIIVFARLDQGFALCMIRRGGGEQWVERTEPHVRFVSSQGGTITHSRVSGELYVEKDNVLPISGPVYAALGRAIPVREISSAAVLFTAVADAQGMRIPTEIREGAAAIIEARAAGVADKALAGRASELFEKTFRLISESGGAIDPFWSKLREYAGIARNQQPEPGQ